MTLTSAVTAVNSSALSTLTNTVLVSDSNSNGTETMTTEQFTYWLQGFYELTGGERPSATQWQAIGDHLQAVFNKVTPQRFATGGQLTPGITSAPGITTLEQRLSPSLLGTAVC